MGNGAEDGRAEEGRKENKDRGNGTFTAQSNFVTKMLKETKKKRKEKCRCSLGYNPIQNVPPSSTVEVWEPLTV